MKKLFGAMIVLLLFLGCKKQLPEDFDSFGKLVYVEALSNTDGITAGSFGDIMILDPVFNVKYRVTKDQYYDESTSWFHDGSKIIFASRRTGDRKYKDLASPSRLFEVNIKTLEVKQVDMMWDEKLHLIDKEIECNTFYYPTCSKNESSIFFSTCRNDTLHFVKYQIIKYDFLKDSFIFVRKYFNGIPNIVISHNSLFLASTSSYIDWNTEIKMYDLNKNKRIKSINKKKWSFKASAFYNDKMFFIGKDLNLDKPPSNLYEFDLTTMESKLLYSFVNYNIQEFVLRDSVSAFFINEDPNHRNDIYLLDFKTWKSEPLTTDGLQKIGLDYLPPKKDK